MKRYVARGGGTAAVGGSVVPSADGLGAGAVGTGRAIEGSAVEETLGGAEVVAEGAWVAGVKTSTVGGGAEREWLVKTTNATPPPAAARQPAAASGLAHRNSAQRRWPLARRRKASQGSARASSGTPAG